MSQSAQSLGEGVKTFQIRSSQVMFHPDFIQAVENLYHLMKSPIHYLIMQKFETKKAMLYRPSDNLNSPLQIWWMNTWNNWFLLGG